MDEVDERLMAIRKKLKDDSHGRQLGKEPGIDRCVVEAMEKDGRLSRFVDVMVAALPHLNKGMVVEVSKKGGGYTVNVVPPISKLALYSLIANAAMVALLVTKIVGLW